MKKEKLHRSFTKMAVGRSYSSTFPLILTFSRWEKEQPLAGFLKSASSQAESRFGFAKTLGAFPPLPAGEGRGEGEHDYILPDSVIQNSLSSGCVSTS
jgi:hypothetical protein